MKTLDLHGIRHDEVERLVENLILLNDEWKIICGNSDKMIEIVREKLDWAYDNTDQDATIAVQSITGLPTNDFSEMVIGTFYQNSFLGDSVYTGLSCASAYNGASSFAQMTVYADEVYTTEKDGFEFHEELTYIVLYNDQEYYATASYMESFSTGWGVFELVSENIFTAYSLYSGRIIYMCYSWNFRPLYIKFFYAKQFFLIFSHFNFFV